MESRKFVISQTLTVLAGNLLLSALMVGIFAFLDRFDTGVLLGAAVGAAISTLNFLIMALAANLAADKAEKQDVKGGQTLIQLSYMGRLIGLFLILVVCAKTGVFNLVALVLPLAFTRPILTITELFRKKGGC